VAKRGSILSAGNIRGCSGLASAEVNRELTGIVPGLQ
jgi:hypothetical protein